MKLSWIASMMVVAGCELPAGDEGVPGRAGPKGDPGTDGRDGVDGPRGPAGPSAPHLALRDRDGERVDAIVSAMPGFVGPYLGGVHPAVPTEFGTAGPRCVTLSHVGEQYVGNTMYELASGSALACYPSIGSSPRDAPYWFAYVDANCAGPAYLMAPSLAVVRIADTLYAAGGTTPDLAAVTTYWWDGTRCHADAVSDVWQLEPIPAFVRDALSRAPYTLSPEY